MAGVTLCVFHHSRTVLVSFDCLTLFWLACVQMDLNACITYTDWASFKSRHSDAPRPGEHPFTASTPSNVKYLVQEARQNSCFFVRKILPGDWLKQCSFFDNSTIKCRDGIKVSSTYAPFSPSTHSPVSHSVLSSLSFHETSTGEYTKRSDLLLSSFSPHFLPYRLTHSISFLFLVYLFYNI